MRARVEQLCLALVFLTRLPLARLLPSDRIIPLNRAVWAFPLAGLVVGALAGLPLWLDGPPLLLAALSLAISVWLTGALHEDGLADFADGMGGRDRTRRLEIMRDSRIGSYGMAALVLVLLIRWSALAPAGPGALIAAAVGGRAAIVLAMVTLPPARADGLGRAASGIGAGPLLLAAAICAAMLLTAGTQGAAALLAGLVAAGMVIRQARDWLGGQTGDVLGTTCIVVETAMLVAFALTV